MLGFGNVISVIFLGLNISLCNQDRSIVSHYIFTFRMQWRYTRIDYTSAKLVGYVRFTGLSYLHETDSEYNVVEVFKA